MSKNELLVKESGYLLISDSGVSSCGFDFYYRNDLFDGCRLGQLSPLMWAQKKINDYIQDELIANGSTHCENWCDHKEASDPKGMADAMARMIMENPPFNIGSDEMIDFIVNLSLEMKNLNES